MNPLQFATFDVFAEQPLHGTSLSVVRHDEPLEARLMQALMRELRQFETVFVRPTSDRSWLLSIGGRDVPLDSRRLS